ncbi:MAG: hypothetical protein AVO33_00780 [delta proteobacterium ML8_F1]|nr:MAG: hypothetical protein AVO33_00780 [delta proteobacterium ML8_F1]
MIKIMGMSALLVLYHWGIKPLILALADEFFKAEPLFREGLFVAARDILDVFFALGMVVLFFVDHFVTFLVAAGLLGGLYASVIKESLVKSRMKTLEAIINLMGNFYHHMVEGGVIQGIFNSPGSDVILWYLIKENRGDFEGLESLAREIGESHLNQLMLTLKKTRYYDSEQILDEMAFIYEEALKSFFESKRVTTEKLSQGLVVPMALYLVNLIALILLPHLQQLI